jgi:predicted nucleic acid-binding Zn ribbon protein
MCPSYAYFCEECGKEEETFLQRLVTDDDDKKQVCCGVQMTRPIYSPACITFVGKGKYIQNPGFDNDNEEYNFFKKKLNEKIKAKNGIE